MNEEEMNNLMESVAETMPKHNEDSKTGDGSQTSQAVTNISIPQPVKRNVTKDLEIEEICAQSVVSPVQDVSTEYEHFSQTVNTKIRQEFQNNLLFVPKITDKKNGNVDINL